MNTTFMLMMVLPVIASGWLLYKYSEEFTYSAGNKWKAKLFFPAMIVPGGIVLAVVFYASFSSAVDDVEIWNGVITGKNRVHDTYQRSYSCNCRTIQSCSGFGQNRSCTSSSSCDTCYETRYTVEWLLKSDIGEFQVDKEDSGSRRVNNLPDPPLYSQANAGDPAARRNVYTNYIQAVPDTLFEPSAADVKARFATTLPPYPDNVHSLYKINRFIPVGLNFPDAQQWSDDISEMLKTIGPQKQVNVIVVAVRTEDPSYMYALRDAWEGANKNDVVLIIGSMDGVNISWVDVISWTSRELFKIELRDGVKDMKTVDRAKIIPLISAQITKNFERRRMREFQYLENEIDPPMWVLGIAAAVLAVIYGGMWYSLNRVAKSHRRM